MESEQPQMDCIATYDEYDLEDGTHVVDRYYWCRICGNLSEPCEHFKPADTEVKP